VIPARNQRRRPFQPDWPRSLLQALRAGRLRVVGLNKPTLGMHFQGIRAALDGLPAHLQVAVRQALAGRIASSTTRRPLTQTDAEIWLTAARQRALPSQSEAVLLQVVGRDRYGRTHRLQPVAAQALKGLRDAAQTQSIALEVISSFRSHQEQARILLRKRLFGQTWEQILSVNAPPGFSEHHSGCAIDFAIPEQAPLTEAFEHTAAFAWLRVNAAHFGFRMSYPRNNPSGFVYEPWHWCYVE